MNTPSESHFPGRIAFRFVFIYFISYNLRFLLADLPFIEPLGKHYENTLRIIVPWVGKHILHLQNDITVFTRGSGDTTYDYVLVLCLIVISAGAALSWTVLERKPVDYQKLHQWLRVYVRYSLALAMITYGVVKIIPGGQFPAPTLDRLLQPFGDASPMGLLWTFMGASKGYNMFAGAAEIAGGLLLITPRTTLLGSLVCFGVLTNVVMLNLCYDVPVKLYSLHLAMMSIFLVFPDVRRLADLLLFNRPVEPIEHRPLFTQKRLNVAAQLFGIGFMLLFTGWSLYDLHTELQAETSPAARSPFHGIWFVEEFEVDGQVRPPLLTDGERWRRVVFDYPEWMAIQLVNDSRRRFLLDLNLEKKTLTLGNRDNPDWEAVLTFDRPESEILLVEGDLDNYHLRARLHRIPEPQFLLKNRGFHWVTEYSFNR
ncbi:MAG: hypothetical protein HY774_10960 [Acidobacteria bacterium]|nr:hypothetical protein [Acidobacteriota bacterium]